VLGCAAVTEAVKKTPEATKFVTVPEAPESHANEILRGLPDAVNFTEGRVNDTLEQSAANELGLRPTLEESVIVLLVVQSLA
jgi:hypothetical protein